MQDVDPDGRAAAAGIQPKDVIQEVNRKPVQSVDELRAAVKSATDRPVLLLVNREGKDLFVTSTFVDLAYSRQSITGGDCRLIIASRCARPAVGPAPPAERTRSRSTSGFRASRRRAV